MYTFSSLTQILLNNEVAVTFTKVDGSIRRMRCTLNHQYLPEAYQQEKGALLTEGDGEFQTISAFDLDINEWRSFRLSNVKSISILNSL